MLSGVMPTLPPHLLTLLLGIFLKILIFFLTESHFSSETTAKSHFTPYSSVSNGIIETAKYIILFFNV